MIASFMLSVCPKSNIRNFTKSLTVLWYSFLFSRVNAFSGFISWDCFFWFDYLIFKRELSANSGFIPTEKLASSHLLVTNCSTVAGLANYSLASVSLSGILGDTHVFSLFLPLPLQVSAQKAFYVASAILSTIIQLAWIYFG